MRSRAISTTHLTERIPKQFLLAFALLLVAQPAAAQSGFTRAQQGTAIGYSIVAYCAWHQGFREKDAAMTWAEENIAEKLGLTRYLTVQLVDAVWPRAKQYLLDHPRRCEGFGEEGWK